MGLQPHHHHPSAADGFHLPVLLIPRRSWTSRVWPSTTTSPSSAPSRCPGGQTASWCDASAAWLPVILPWASHGHCWRFSGVLGRPHPVAAHDCLFGCRALVLLGSNGTIICTSTCPGPTPSWCASLLVFVALPLMFSVRSILPGDHCFDCVYTLQSHGISCPSLQSLVCGASAAFVSLLRLKWGLACSTYRCLH